MTPAPENQLPLPSARDSSPARKKWSDRFEKIRQEPQFQALLAKLSPEEQDRVQEVLQELVDRVERTVLSPLAAVVAQAEKQKPR